MTITHQFNMIKKLIGGCKHKRYSSEFKNQISKGAKETINVSLVARNHELVATRWVRDSKNANFTTNSVKYNNDNKDIVKENDRFKKY